jgi:hypothetical protein
MGVDAVTKRKRLTDNPNRRRGSGSGTGAGAQSIPAHSTGPGHGSRCQNRN